MLGCADGSFALRNSESTTAARPVVLLATNHLYGWTGSETLLLTLTEWLRTHGCELTVYARRLDRVWASRQIGEGVYVTDDLDTLRARSFDLAHVQHNSCLMDVRAAFPSLPIVFASLGVLPFLEQPAPFDCGIYRFLAISEEVLANLVACGVPAERIEIVRNLVSEQRFAPTEPIRSRPERILVLSYKMGEARKLMLQAAAHIVGASIRFIGGARETLAQDQLAVAINAADIVVSLGRGVVESMLCGRVPLVFDVHGGDGLVTPANMDELRTCNFSGRCHRWDYTIDDLVVEIGKYRPEYGMQLRERALAQFGLVANQPRVLAVYAAAAEAIPLPNADRQSITAFCSALAREDLLFSLHQQLAINALTAEIGRIKATFSWQITKPLRLLAFLWRKLISAISSFRTNQL